MRRAACFVVMLALLCAGCVNSVEKITPPGKVLPAEGAEPTRGK